MDRRTIWSRWLGVPLLLLAFAASVHGAAREYYVATDGDDNNPGTQASPFRTINKACSQLLDRHDGLPVGGVTVWIRDGVYRETVRPRRSGRPDAPVRFVACPGENPVISGADILDVPWTVHSGKIYKASTTVVFEQLFVDGQMMQEARWPNTPIRDLIRARHATCDDGTNEAILVDDALPQGDWNDAYVHIRAYPGWDYRTKRIADYSAGKSIELSEVGWADFRRKTMPGDHYWLFGSLAGLDRATEWFLDDESQLVYLWCPGDPDPACHMLEVKQREYAFDLSGRDHIGIEGLRMFAAGVSMDNSTHCTVAGCHLKCPVHRRIVPASVYWSDRFWTSNYMSGSYNEWKDTVIAHSSGQGIHDMGYSNRVTNCIIHDWAYAGNGSGAIQATSGASYGQYANNTVYEGAGDGVKMYTASYLRIERNDISRVGTLLSDDQACIWGGWRGPGGTVIMHNYLHDNCDTTDGDGVNVNISAQYYRIHHNLVWNVVKGIRVDAVELNNEVYNNTVFNCAKSAFNLYCGEDITQDGGITVFINNIANGPIVFRGPKTPSQHHNGYYPVDANGWPTADSGAIDAGVVLPGITDGYVGAAPDIGCFEVGTEG